MGLYATLAKKIINWLNEETRPRPDIQLSDYTQTRHEVRPGDVILVEGLTRIAQIISAATNSPWTHTALYLGRYHDIDDAETRKIVEKFYQGDRGDQLILESVLGKGTIVTNLAEYGRDHLRICRPRGLSHQDAQKVLQYAACQLGIDYNLRQSVDLMRLVLPWPIFPRRWRSTLFEVNHGGGATRQICSSLIAEAFHSVKFPILPLIIKDPTKGIQFIQRNPRLYAPSDFDFSPYFDIIKYPFISESPQYRNIPWTEEPIMSDLEGKIHPSIYGQPKE
jgi:hypothetical protein